MYIIAYDHLFIQPISKNLSRVLSCWHHAKQGSQDVIFPQLQYAQHLLLDIEKV